MLLSAEIISAFNHAFQDAKKRGEQEPTAMTLATSDGKGHVTSRTVLLKALDENGFVFFTNTQSTKGRQMALCPRVSATFFWKVTGVQVQLVGNVTPVSDEAADAYFATRDRGSQVGAWASDQSRPLDSREALLERVRFFEKKFQNAEVPRPPHWTGFTLEPDSVEFWTQREYRLHDRIVYTARDGTWDRQRRFP